MRRRLSSWLVIGMMIPLSGSHALAAKGNWRVVEEEIVLQDPTVASASRWAVGASLEGWYVSGSHDQRDLGGNLVPGSISGSQPGGSVHVGYGNFSLQYSHRKGRYKIAQRYAGGALVDGTQTHTEDEAILRYFFNVSKHFNPYVLGGVNRVKLEDSRVLTNGFLWSTGSSVYNQRMTLTSAMIGVGMLVPIDSRFGLRADLRNLAGGSRTLGDDGTSSFSQVAGAALTATAYMNVFRGFHVQVGGRAHGMGGRTAGGFYRAGMFGSAGYSYKF